MQGVHDEKGIDHFLPYFSQILIYFAQIWHGEISLTNLIPNCQLIRYSAPRMGIGSARINWESDKTLGTRVSDDNFGKIII